MSEGRRFLPPSAGDDGAGRPAQRVAAVSTPIPQPSPGARRAMPTPATDDGTRRAWTWLIALGVALSIAVAVMFLAFGGRDLTTAPATTDPAPSPGASGSAYASGSTSAAPSASSAAPSPTASDAGSASPQPTSPPTPSPEVIDLGDATVTVPAGWEIYADELVQDERRLVRLRDPATDTRVQAVTLTSVEGELDQACRDLVTDQQEGFGGVAESVVIDVPLTGAAAAVSCAFTGTRTADGVAAKVEFTLIRRDSDSQSLLFRDTVATSLAPDSPALAQLTAMECAAARSFGVLIGSC